MEGREADILYIRRRNVWRWTVILLVVLILTAAVRMRITDVTVLGNDTYSAQEAEDLIFSDYWDRNTVVCIWRGITKNKKTLPFVEDYKIVLKSPFSCELRFYEKKPIGCLRYISNYMYFDRDGIVIESSPDRLEGIPVVEGLRYGYIVLGKPLPVDSRLLLNSIMSVTQQLALYEIPCEVVRYNETTDSVTAILDDGDLEVVLGNDDYLAAKISVLKDMLPEIRARGFQGILNLSNYDDRANTAAITMKLKEGRAAGAGTQAAEGPGDTDTKDPEQDEQ